MPGSSVLHHLIDFAQIRVHRVVLVALLSTTQIGASQFWRFSASKTLRKGWQIVRYTFGKKCIH